MQTVKIIYCSLWILLTIPLVLFNLKRVFRRQDDGRKKANIPSIILVSILFTLVSVFIFFSYRTTMASRYEVAAERYITEHARYLVGTNSYDQYLEKTAVQREGDFIPEQESLDKGVSDGKFVRFQFGDWITPAKFKGIEGFPETVILSDDANPVFLFYTMSDGVDTVFFLVGLQSDVNGSNWKITYHDVLPEEIATNSQFNSFKPNAKNGKWYNISA